MAVFKELVETNNEVRNKGVKVLGEQISRGPGGKNGRRQEGCQRNGAQMVADDRNSRGKREEEVSTTLVGSHLPGHFASVWRALRRRLVAEGLYWLPSIDEFMLLLLCFNLTSFVLSSAETSPSCAGATSLNGRSFFNPPL